MMELIAQGLKIITSGFGIFNLFQSKDMQDRAKAAKDQAVEDTADKNLKEGDVDEINKNLG